MNTINIKTHIDLDFHITRGIFIPWEYFCRVLLRSSVKRDSVIKACGTESGRKVKERMNGF